MATNDPTVHDIIAEQIVGMLESGTAPWRKPWHAGTNGPRNIVTGAPYSGINVFLLLARGYSSPYWMTFKQANDRGGSVLKGEKSTMIVFAKRTTWTDKSDPDNTRAIFVYRYYRVFNLEQTKNVRAPKTELTVVPTETEAIAAADAIMSGYANGPKISETGTEAFYVPATDKITLPPREAFATRTEFHATAFHEMGHSTGHASRLDRKFGTTFGSHDYGREELVAEMTAAFLCAEAGILPAVIENTAAYLANWVRAIKADPKAVITAASQASKAAHHILGTTAERTESNPAA